MCVYDASVNREQQRQPPAARSLDTSMDIMEGMLMGGDKGGLGLEKHIAHKKWTKEAFTDDFDDSDLE